MTWHEAHGALRHRQARRPLRHGARRADPGVRRDRVQGVFKAAVRQGHPVPGGADFARNQLDELTDRAKRWGAKGLVWMKVGDGRRARLAGGEVPVRRAVGIRDDGAEAGDLLLLVADERRWSATCSACCARAGPPAGQRGAACTSCGSSTSRCSRRWSTTGRPSRRTTRSRCRTPTTSTCCSATRRRCCGAVAGLRPRAQRVGAGLGLVRIHRADVQQRDLRPARHLRGGGAAKFGFLLDAVPLRRRRPTPASPSASTGWSPSSPARRTSARSSPSPRRSRAPTR